MSLSQRVIEILLRAKDETSAAYAALTRKQEDVSRAAKKAGDEGAKAGDKHTRANGQPEGTSKC